MERLALCSKILYDIDLLEKKRELENIKAKIIEKPDLTNIRLEKKNLFKKMEETIWEIIVDDDDLYDDCDNIKYYIPNVCAGQRFQIYNYLYKELNNLTENKNNKWCEDVSWNIIFSVDSSIQSLVNIDKIDDFTLEELADFIYNNIIWQLEEKLL